MSVALEPLYDKARYEEIKHDFTWGIAPTKNHDKIVLHHAGNGYAHYRVIIVDRPAHLYHKYSMRDIAIVACEGYAPFGYRTEPCAVIIHTD